MKKYIVISPEYPTIDVIIDYGQGPIEYGCDVVEVEALTKREAKIKAVKEFRRIKAGYIVEDESPFKGLKVVDMTTGEESDEFCLEYPNDVLAAVQAYSELAPNDTVIKPT